MTTTAATSRKRDMRQDRKNEPDEYRKMVARMIRSLGKKIVTQGDVNDLPELYRLQEQLDETLLTTVGALISEPHCRSWQQVADVLTAAGFKTTRQGVQQRYGKRLAERGITPVRTTGAQPLALR